MDGLLTALFPAAFASMKRQRRWTPVLLAAVGGYGRGLLGLKSDLDVRLDEANITEIGQALASIIEAKHQPKLLLDFQNVDHLSSAALGMLINVNQKIKLQSGELRLVNIKPQIYEVFVITKLNKLFKIMPDRSEALASFSPS